MKIVVELPDYICFYQKDDGRLDCVPCCDVNFARFHVYDLFKTATIVRVSKDCGRSVIARKVDGVEIN